MAHKVINRQTGHEFQVEAEETILDAALRQGISLPYGCRGGSCGSCIVTIASGEITYGDRTPLALSDEVIAAGKALACIAKPLTDLVIDVHENVAEELEIKTLPARVAELTRLSHDVMLMKLKLPASERLQFYAGQYIEILLKGGKQRAFSLANPPHDDEYLELHIREVPGGLFTHQVFHEMKVKSLLRIRGPLGSFYLREDTHRPIVLIAGGTGFAPVKSIVEHAIKIGLQVPMAIYWGVRSKRDLYLDELPRQWAQAHPQITYTPVLSEPLEEDQWDGATGWVTDVVAEELGQKLPAYDIYMCGPPAMIKAGKERFAAMGLPEDRLYFDSFEYAHDT